MKASLYNRSVLGLRIMVLALGIAVMSWVPAISQTPPAQTESAPAQPEAQPDKEQGERFWIAGRYDGNRIIVYFDAVKFNSTVPSIRERLTGPVADGFFMPEKLPWTYVAKFQKGVGAEQFKLGDKYDLLLGRGKIASVTLTAMIGTEGDEGVGNDSYIGALATLDDKGDGLPPSKNYYVAYRHRDLSDWLDMKEGHAGLNDEPIRFDVQSQIVDLLTQRMQGTASETDRNAMRDISPMLEVQSFAVADGTTRYYARAEWRWGKPEDRGSSYALGAWISPEPGLHIVAAQTRTSPYEGFDTVLPQLLNVVDLGAGRTGIVLSITGEDSAATRLLEYRDGLDFQHMRLLQSIEAGE